MAILYISLRNAGDILEEVPWTFYNRMSNGPKALVEDPRTKFAPRAGGRAGVNDFSGPGVDLNYFGGRAGVNDLFRAGGRRAGVNDFSRPRCLCFFGIRS